MFPERGDHETTAFPELAGGGRLPAFPHEGLWLTVNTPKEIRVADEHVRSTRNGLTPRAVCSAMTARRGWAT